MYLRYYGLKRHPFHITPDPEFLFLSPSHKEAFAAMVYGIETRKGFITVTGEVGTGKTTVLRAGLEQLRSDKLGVVYFFNPEITFEDLLQNLLKELGQSSKGKKVSWMLDCLHWILINHYRRGCNIVLVIDEAQNMPTATLERLRVLSNLETSTQKLLQVVFVGQPEFDAKLRQHSLRQVAQRIAVRATLEPLGRSESEQYIRHRIACAGGYASRVFSAGAMNTAIKYGRGIPRRLNVLCDNALIAGYASHTKPISSQVIHQVAGDLYAKFSCRYLRWVIPAVGMLALSTCSLDSSPFIQRTATPAVATQAWQADNAQLQQQPTTLGTDNDEDL